MRQDVHQPEIHLAISPHTLDDRAGIFNDYAPVADQIDYGSRQSGFQFIRWAFDF
jgi:hypothetical protein